MAAARAMRGGTIVDATGRSKNRTLLRDVPLEQTGDRQTLDLQHRMADATASARALPFSSGILFKGLSWTAAGTLTVAHKLARNYSGFIVLRVQGTGAVITEEPQDATLNKAQITLRSTAAADADVWIF